jgi:hypothetical protein
MTLTVPRPTAPVSPAEKPAGGGLGPVPTPLCRSHRYDDGSSGLPEEKRATNAVLLLLTPALTEAHSPHGHERGVPQRVLSQSLIFGAKFKNRVSGIQ